MLITVMPKSHYISTREARALARELRARGWKVRNKDCSGQYVGKLFDRLGVPYADFAEAFEDAMFAIHENYSGAPVKCSNCGTVMHWMDADGHECPRID